MTGGALSCGVSSTAGAVSLCGGAVGSDVCPDAAGDAVCPVSAGVSFGDAAAGAVFCVCAEVAVFAGAIDFAEESEPLPVGSPAFQLSDAGTLKEIDLPSVEATIVPASSVR